MATLYDTATKLVSHFNGTDGDTAYTDPVAGAWTFVGTAQLDSAEKKFGTTSLLLDGDSDYVTSPDSASWYFGSGNFTIDFWFMPHAQPATDIDFYLVSQSVDADNRQMLLYSDNGGTKQLRYYVVTGSSYVVNISANVTLTTDAWSHIALVRSGSASWTLYVNGSSVATSTENASVPDYAANLYVGRYQPAAIGYVNGWIDELRVSKGVARWTSNFIPPTAEYAGLDLDENITASDACSLSRIFALLLSETVTLTDNILKIYAKVFLDNITLSEIVNRSASITKSENCVITGGISKPIPFSPLSDTVVITDAFNVWLDKNTKSVTWTTISGGSTTWTPVSASSNTWTNVGT